MDSSVSAYVSTMRHYMYSVLSGMKYAYYVCKGFMTVKSVAFRGGW